MASFVHMPQDSIRIMMTPVFIAARLTLQHTLFHCGEWNKHRRIAQTIVGTIITSDIMIPLMIEAASK